MRKPQWKRFEEQQQQQEAGIQGGRRPVIGGGQQVIDPGQRVTNAEMIMLGSNFDTNSIIDAIQLWVPPAHWLMDTFFPYDRVSDSDLVQLEYYRLGRMIGGFVKPEKRGIARPRKPFQSTVYSPPTVKLTRDLDAASLAKRRIGRTQYEGNNSDGEILAEDTMELINEIINLHEWMCSSLLFTGQLLIEDYDDRVLIDTITFPGVPQRINVLPADYWDQPNVNPFRLVKAMQRLVTAAMGDAANIICMGSDLADAFEENPEVKDQFNKLWIRQGILNPHALEDEPAVYLLGDYRGVPVYVNETSYTDRDGVTQPYFPPDTLLVGSTKQAGLMAFAACYQTEPGSNTAEAVPGKYVPQYWVDHAQDTRRFRMSSRGLPCLHDAQSYVIARAI